MEKHGEEVQQIRTLCSPLPAEFDDVKLLRFALQHPGNAKAAAENVKEVIAWRQGEGKQIVEAAATAVAKAKAGGRWDNTPVMAAAPHSAKVSKYLTPSQMLVVSTKAGDLVSCIRSVALDSQALMKAVSPQELVDFFLYSREVNSLVADERSRVTGHLKRVMHANDLSGMSSFPDRGFQDALGTVAKKAATLYPGYAGPTALLNLPWVARVLVPIFTPLFPGSVREKVKFGRSAMAYLTDLKDVLQEPTRSLFVADLQAVFDS